MTYEDVRNRDVTIECSADARRSYFTGRGNFTGNIGVSVTCPAGTLLDRSQGTPQGAVDNSYYTGDFSSDGRSVSYRFYTGNDAGRSADFYVSGGCEPTT
ncbi:hypothetical protein ACQPX6_06145 [Actinomycetospora sp. CA-101289]|uniref:hypothetical protein n=1 Tax=Actinomycetospora sp. CA-101289 TaxID=3239893 RepID=UPI003D991DE6